MRHSPNRILVGEAIRNQDSYLHWISIVTVYSYAAGIEAITAPFNPVIHLSFRYAFIAL
jgi:hypothetical protein